MTIKHFKTTLLLATTLVAAAGLPAAMADSQGWTLDPSHTEINFSVKHFFTPVSGTFEEFDAVLKYDPEHPERSTVEARIPVSSIETGNSMRDDHLRSEDWFEADKHPYITFRSTSMRKKGKKGLVATGPLTIKGITRQIEVPIELLGSQPIPEKMQKMMGGATEIAGFHASLTIDRADFEVGVGSWAATMVVGGEIAIDILAEAHLR